MNDDDLEKYCTRAIQTGITHAKQIDPSTVVTAPWVRLKCQYGCIGYDITYCCPPYSPTPEQTRATIDSYGRAILFHLETSWDCLEEHFPILRDMEGEMFKDGYYKALLFLSGPCFLCKECARNKNEPCKLRFQARPSMEACGIDVYQTVRNNGFPIDTLSDQSQQQNHYCLMLVD